MRSNSSFDFTVDKAAKTVYITSELPAELSLVWDTFTKPEFLDQWTAPAPSVARTKYMNFEVGGKRFYAMVNSKGHEGWSIQEYTSIAPKTNFKTYNTFTDKDGNPELPGSDWDYNFSEQNGITTVRITIFNESFDRMEKEFERGFQQRFTATLKTLENLLRNLTEVI